VNAVVVGWGRLTTYDHAFDAKQLLTVPKEPKMLRDKVLCKSACSGAHLKRTGEIGTEKLKRNDLGKDKRKDRDLPKRHLKLHVEL
jgi:hypothetical protein